MGAWVCIYVIEKQRGKGGGGKEGDKHTKWPPLLGQILEMHLVLDALAARSTLCTHIAANIAVQLSLIKGLLGEAGLVDHTRVVLRHRGVLGLRGAEGRQSGHEEG